MILGLEKFCDDVEQMIGHRPGLYWRICWKFISPMFIIVSFFFFKYILFNISNRNYNYW